MMPGKSALLKPTACASQAVKKDLHDFNQQGTYNRLSHSTPASSLPSPDTLGAAFHVPHPSPLKDAVKAALSPAEAPAADPNPAAARSSQTGRPRACWRACRHSS